MVWHLGSSESVLFEGLANNKNNDSTKKHYYRHNTLFSPELPDEKITSIQKMSIGLVNKVIMSFPHKWWDQNKIYVMIEADKSGDLWFTRHGDATTPFALDTALTVWLAGDAAKMVSYLWIAFELIIIIYFSALDTALTIIISLHDSLQVWNHFPFSNQTISP